MADPSTYSFPLWVRVIKTNDYQLPIGKGFAARKKDGDASPFPYELWGERGQIFQMKADEIQVERLRDQALGLAP